MTWETMRVFHAAAAMARARHRPDDGRLNAGGDASVATPASATATGDPKNCGRQRISLRVHLVFTRFVCNKKSVKIFERG
jgi:hypothetical protein